MLSVAICYCHSALSITTLSIIDTENNNAMPCAECPYAEYCILFTIMPNGVMLCVVMMSVIIPNAVVLFTAHPWRSLVWREEVSGFNANLSL
jgi:hypothetical protein